MERNNKLIAEFMGNPTIFNTIHDATLYQVKEQGNMTYHVDELQYHNSWDWLMPVANEIIKSRDEQNADWDLTDLKYALQTTNIELVYKAVVEFIKEYNKYICGSCGDNCNEYTYNEETDVDECNQCKTINQKN